MTKSENQKLKILYLMQMLLNETDSDHTLTVGEIIEKLSSQYGIQAERKTIYKDLENLREYGLDIKSDRSKPFGRHIVSRDFDLPELKLLVDVIQSSKFITEKKSEEFIRKIEGLTSVYQAKKLQGQVHVNNRVKTMNESIYYNVDAIQDAIAQNRRISFKYYTYNINKEKICRHNGRKYQLDPIFLTWDDQNYYLVAFCPVEKHVKHFRVDKMLAISIEEEKRDDSRPPVDPATYSNKVFGMFGGTESAVELEFANTLIGVVVDRFGLDVPVIQKKEKSFVIHVKIEISSVFIGWLFQFGEQAKVLAPKSLADNLKNRAARLLEQYS